MSPVNYHLRDDLRGLIICLYEPAALCEDVRFSRSELWNYITDCGCQLEQGEPVKRFPYYLATCPADADHAEDHFRQQLAELRKMSRKKKPASNDRDGNSISFLWQGMKSTPEGKF